MQKYFDSVLVRGVGAVEGAHVAVTDVNGNPAALYSDNGVTAQANPVVTDANGYFSFYAADGRYTLTITGRGFSTRQIADVLLEDPDDGTSALEASAGATLVGYRGRSVYLKLREMDSLADFGAVPNVSADQTLKIQEAINEYAATNSTTAKLRATPGKWNFEGQLSLPGHLILSGHGSDRYGPGAPGTEFAYQGTSSGPSIITALSDDEDWSKGGIEHLRLHNYSATAGTSGLAVRNPQNAAFLRNVTVSGFADRQIKIYEPSGRVSGAGTCPGFFYADGIWAIGGDTPLEVQAGVEQIVISNWGVDTDATSTRGMLVTKTTSGQPQRAPIKLLGGKIEIQQSSPDIHGLEWNADLALSCDTVHVQRNDNITSTKSAFYYSGTTRNIPTAELRNCTSWNLLNLYRFNAAGIAKAAGAITSPESFSYSCNNAVSAFPFWRETLTASMASQPLYTAGSANLGGVGYVAHRPCFIEGISARHTAVLTAGTATLSVIKNGVTFVTSIVLNSANQGRFTDLASSGTSINSSNFQLAPGDRISAQVTTSSDLAPTGGHVLLEVFVRWI